MNKKNIVKALGADYIFEKVIYEIDRHLDYQSNGEFDRIKLFIYTLTNEQIVKDLRSQNKNLNLAYALYSEKDNYKRVVEIPEEKFRLAIDNFVGLLESAYTDDDYEDQRYLDNVAAFRFIMRLYNKNELYKFLFDPEGEELSRESHGGITKRIYEMSKNHGAKSIILLHKNFEMSSFYLKNPEINHQEIRKGLTSVNKVLSRLMFYFIRNYEGDREFVISMLMVIDGVLKANERNETLLEIQNNVQEDVTSIIDYPDQYMGIDTKILLKDLLATQRMVERTFHDLREYEKAGNDMYMKGYASDLLFYIFILSDLETVDFPIYHKDQVITKEIEDMKFFEALRSMFFTRGKSVFDVNNDKIMSNVKERFKMKMKLILDTLIPTCAKSVDLKSMEPLAYCMKTMKEYLLIYTQVSEALSQSTYESRHVVNTRRLLDLNELKYDDSFHLKESFNKDYQFIYTNLKDLNDLKIFTISHENLTKIFGNIYAAFELTSAFEYSFDLKDLYNYNECILKNVEAELCSMVKHISIFRGVEEPVELMKEFNVYKFLTTVYMSIYRIQDFMNYVTPFKLKKLKDTEALLVESLKIINFADMASVREDINLTTDEKEKLDISVTSVYTDYIIKFPPNKYLDEVEKVYEEEKSKKNKKKNEKIQEDSCDENIESEGDENYHDHGEIYQQTCDKNQ